MKRIAALTLAGGLVAGAHSTAAASSAVVQENVRHITTVPGTTGGHVVVEGNRLYMGNYGIGMTIYDVSNPAAPTLVGEYRPGDRPVADAVPDAAEYPERTLAVLGGTSRASNSRTTDWLDVTNPAEPVLLHQMVSSGSSPDGEAHNADIVDERKLYLPSGGHPAGLRIYDISPLLEEPAQPPALISANNPATLWAESPFRGERPTHGGFSHIHDIQVYTDVSVLLTEDEWVDQDGDGLADPTYGPRDLALLAEGGSYLAGNDSGSFMIIDITDPANPVARLRWKNTTGQPLRYYHEAQLLDSDPHIAFVSDEDLHNGCEAGGVSSLALSEDYTEATLLDQWFNGTGTPAPNCSAHVFSTHGDYVFMGSYNAGLQVIDFSDPANLTRAGQYIAEGANAWGALYHEGYIYTGDFGGRGLDVFEFFPAVARRAFVKVGSPLTEPLGGPRAPVSETLGECDTESPADAVDGFVVPIPEESRGSEHTFYARGTSEAGSYDVDIWFYDEGCTLLGDGHLATGGTDQVGPIPDEAAFAYVNMWLGRPQWVYAQIDPPFGPGI